MNHNIFRPEETFLPNTERTLILVDWSNLMYRAWFVSSERPWVAFCKFFDMLRLCIHKSKQPGVPVEVIFAGESRTKLRRTELFNDYKGNRKPNKNPDFAKFRAMLIEILEKIGWNLLSVDGAEADDVIASIVVKKCHRCFCIKKCENCDCVLKYRTDVVIFSGDRDLQQLLAWDRVMIYRSPGVFVTKKSFEEEYGIPVEKYEVYKALIGDKSDNISGVEGFGPAKAKIAINAGSVAEDIWELGGKISADQFRSALMLVILDKNLKFSMDDLYVGGPIFDSNEPPKGIDKRVALEIARLKEEF